MSRRDPDRSHDEHGRTGSARADGGGRGASNTTAAGSTGTGGATPGRSVGTDWLREVRSSGVDALAGPPLFRVLALANALVLVGASVYVLREVTAVVGGTRSLLAVVAVALVAATVAANVLGLRAATLGAIAATAIGFAYYLSSAGVSPGVVFSATGELVEDTLTLVMGLSLLRLTEVGTWTLGFAPAPAFLTWYLALRRRYALAVVPGGAALLFLVLTGDATTLPALVGTIAGVAVVAFGELERRDGAFEQVDVLAVLFAVMMVLSLSVSVIPGGSGGTGAFGFDAGSDPGTLNGAVAAAPDRSPIGGSVELSPQVQFTVESEEPSYWRTGVYDRFTGDEWVRSGQASGYRGSLDGPPGETKTVRQTVTAEGNLEVMPTAAQPVAIEGDVQDRTLVTDHGQVRPASRLLEGDAYTVVSEVPDPSPAALRSAGTDYPAYVEERYLQTPSGTSDGFESYADEVTADAETPYQTALAVERHLRGEKDYSLDVERPDGNVAEGFLFEMDEGYCVYFATTMTQLLRSEDVPARYVTGYTPGERVDDNEWVVRGLDAHAWVEVYFPGQGWVPFEPTPSGPRADQHGDVLDEARADGVDGVDTDASEEAANLDEPGDPGDENGAGDPGGENGTDDPGDENGGNDTENGSGGESRPPGIGPDAGGDDGGSVADAFDGVRSGDDGRGLPIPVPSATVTLLGLILFVGVAATGRRADAGRRLRRAAAIHWQGGGRSPAGDVERAYRRLELSLERRYRPRDPGETPRQYVDSVCPGGGDSGATSGDGSLSTSTVEDVLARYERVRYGDGTVDPEVAAETVAAVDRLTRGRLPLVGRRWR